MATIFRDVYSDLRARGQALSLHILDNERSKAVKNYIRSEETSIQLVEPHNYRVNAAKPAFKRVKYYTIPSLATIDPNRPIHLWCKFLPQIEIALNILHTSRNDETKSAYESLHHKRFDWDVKRA